MTTAADSSEHKRDEDRQDTQLALDDTRWDAEHKRDEDRDDTQLALANTRWDAQYKRDEDRDDTQLALDAAGTPVTQTRRRPDDTQLALDNTRWDADHKRDEDRQDTADALSHSRQDAALAVEWTLYQAVHNGYIAVVRTRSVNQSSAVRTSRQRRLALSLFIPVLLPSGFSTSSKSTLLPARGLLALFLRCDRVVFSTFFLAFLRKRTMVLEVLPSGLGGDFENQAGLYRMGYGWGGGSRLVATPGGLSRWGWVSSCCRSHLFQRELGYRIALGQPPVS